MEIIINIKELNICDNVNEYNKEFSYKDYLEYIDNFDFRITDGEFVFIKFTDIPKSKIELFSSFIINRLQFEYFDRKQEKGFEQLLKD